MSKESRKLAGLLLVIMPSVAFGGISLLSMIFLKLPYYMELPVRQDLFRAGHAHAGVLLVLSLIILRYVDEAALSGPWKVFAMNAVPAAAVLMPAGFFLSIAVPGQTQPNALIYLVYLGALLLMAGLTVVGVGLLRAKAG